MIGRGNKKRKEVKQMPIYKTPFEEPAPEETTDIYKCMKNTARQKC